MSSSGWKNKVSRRQKKIAPKETWFTCENNYSWADKEQNPNAERNTSDSNWLLPSENRTRRKHYSTHFALLFSTLFANIHKKTRFSSYQIPACLKTFCQWKTSLCKVVFLSSIQCSGFCLFSQFTSKRCTCNSQKYRHFTAMFSFSILFLLLLLYVKYTSLVWSYGDSDTACVCLCCLLAWLWLSVWPLHSLQRPSPGLTTRSMDMSWWKTWVTRFMAIRAADENGKARAGLKKMNPSLFFLNFYSKSRQKMRNTDMSGDTEKENKK